MKKQKLSLKLFSFLFIVIGIISITLIFASNVETLSKYGSTGSEVTQIQTKLKRWGYYSRRYRWNIWLKNFICC